MRYLDLPTTLPNVSVSSLKQTEAALIRGLRIFHGLTTCLAKVIRHGRCQDGQTGEEGADGFAQGGSSGDNGAKMEEIKGCLEGERLAKRRRVGFGSSVLIYHLEGLSPYAELAEVVVTGFAKTTSLQGPAEAPGTP